MYLELLVFSFNNKLLQINNDVIDTFTMTRKVCIIFA